MASEKIKDRQWNLHLSRGNSSESISLGMQVESVTFHAAVTDVLPGILESALIG